MNSHNFEWPKYIYDKFVQYIWCQQNRSKMIATVTHVRAHLTLDWETSVLIHKNVSYYVIRIEIIKGCL
jgi:hypothetical protein